MNITLGEEPISTFTQAVKRTFDLAMARLPKELHGHLERAHALVLHHHVFPTDDGKHAQVLSSDGTRWYPVNGHCTCMDASKAPQGLCKHRLAFGLYRRASELLTTSGARPQSAAADKTTLPEAPASVNCHVLIEGRTVQVTLRDTDEDRLLTRLAALLARYPAAACPAQGGAQASAPAPTPGETPVCPHHGKSKESTKAKGTFFCPSKMADGTYCQWRHPAK